MQKLTRIILIFCRPVSRMLSLHCVCNINSFDNLCFTEVLSLQLLIFLSPSCVRHFEKATLGSKSVSKLPNH